MKPQRGAQEARSNKQEARRLVILSEAKNPVLRKEVRSQEPEARTCCEF